MNRRAFSILFCAAVSSFAAGCHSYVPVTQELREEHRLGESELKSLQFYNSHDIVLRRELARGDRQVTGSHELLVIAGKQIEEVVVPKHTPGVVVGVAPGRLQVSFEPGTFFEFQVRDGDPIGEPLVIGPRFAEAPDPFPGDRPDPLVPEKRAFHLPGTGNYWLLPFEGSSVSFQGKTYDAVEDSSLAHLVISTESLDEVEEEKTVLRGRKL